MAKTWNLGDALAADLCERLGSDYVARARVAVFMAADPAKVATIVNEALLSFPVVDGERLVPKGALGDAVLAAMATQGSC